MPGLRNRSTWAPLLLKTSEIMSCANGCSLGITAHLTYVNTDPETVEGVFVYPLGEKEVVVGFEAVVSGRLVSVELRSRGKLEECCLDCCPGTVLHSQATQGREWGCCGRTGLEMQCSNGHLLLDEDLERNTFIVSTGQIGPLEIVSVVISTTLELPTLENGAIRLVYPTVLTPISLLQLNDMLWQCVRESRKDSGSRAAMSTLSSHKLCHKPCLESPTHALRADADPSAQSASATYITLAEEHPCDRPLEIILHLSEPHSPLVILERGRLTFSEYEQQVWARCDFIRYARKKPESEKKLEFLRRRYHKDLLLNPVLMLNFCPDLLSEPTDLQQASRELIFLIDNSSTMSQHINKIKEAMLVVIKSLPTCSLLNFAVYCSTVRPLFSSSRTCTDSTVRQVLEFIQKVRTDHGSANLLGALSWVYRQPVQRRRPRQVFIIMDGSLSNVGHILEVVRRNACNVRCFGVGLSPRACRRLLQGVAKVTGGSTEFLSEEERLQPKLMKCLKKALEPVLTDVRIDWYLPDNIEALLSPNEIPPLYPGNCLIGYCTLYNLSGFRAQKTETVKPHVYKSRPRGSAGSILEFSPSVSEHPMEERMDAAKGCELEGDFVEALREISREISSEFSCAHATENAISPVEGSVMGMGSLPHGLERVEPTQSRGLSRWQSPWSQNTSPSGDTHVASGKAGKLLDESQRRQKALARCALAGRSFSSPQGDLDMHRLRRALEKVSFEQTVEGLLEENGLLFPATPLDWDTFTDPENLFSAVPPPEHLAAEAQCRSVIHGNLGGRPVSWEVCVDLSLLWNADQSTTVPTSAGPWDEIIHQLTARSVIRDFENMAEKETDKSKHFDMSIQSKPSSLGSSKRYRMKAIQTSKSCGIVCMYTSFSTTDTNAIVRSGKRHSSRSDSRRQKLCSMGFGHRPSRRDSEDTEEAHSCTDRDDTPASPCSMASWDSSTGGSISPSALSSRSQRSIESFFGSKFNLGRLKGNNGKQTPLKAHCFSAETERPIEVDIPDYLPLVRIQLATGAFLLSESFSHCIQIPLDRLKRASPYLIHRTSLSPTLPCASPPSAALLSNMRDLWSEALDERSPNLVGGIPQADSGRGSETDACEIPPLDPTEHHGEDLAQMDMESSSWATAVALAWLEHRCAGFFVEWELVAAKADFWLKSQSLPEGIDL
ncbi:hypothetical protein DNTS_035405, partial [Danionella cerebrum]